MPRSPSPGVEEQIERNPLSCSVRGQAWPAALHMNREQWGLQNKWWNFASEENSDETEHACKAFCLGRVTAI